MTNKPPAIIGVRIAVEGSFCRSTRSSGLKYSHLKTYARKMITSYKYASSHIHCILALTEHALTKFQSKPPRRSAEAPIYWNVSMLMTSMTGHTTRVTSSATRSSSGSSHISLHSQWLSRNVSTSASAVSAPRTLDRTKPSRLSLRITLTLFIFANSKPSSANCVRVKNKLVN